MKKIISQIAAVALIFGATSTISNAGCDYIFGNECSTPDECCFSYDYVDIAYLYSNYGSAVPPNVFGGAAAPNASIIDKLKGVDIEFKKAIGCNFYFSGEFYNTDGVLSDQIVAANPALFGKRAEFYYYRAGVGYHHSLADNIDFTFEGGGLYWDCRVPAKHQDEWGWYISPGLRVCMGFGELYANYMYENFETQENHRFEGGAIVPVTECMSFKLAGRYETEYEKSSFLAGIRFNY
ncbi:MAG: hypothetical protein P1V20_04545 [Verrucomicrobiales bacterium]|nr:hypothetical protein [Verrucomicrobiales bacterium]